MPPPDQAVTAPAPAAPIDTLSAEEARDLAAIQAETFHGPVGSSNEDLDDELEKFLSEESHVLLTEKVGYDIPIVVNARVEYFIDYFQHRVNKSFAKWLARSKQYIPYLQARFRQAGMPEDLVYLALIESGFSAQATSRANAVGYWQFIAATARRYGLRVDGWLDERRDFEKSTEAAIAYLKDLHSMFGSWYLAAAAYNSGEAKIQRAIARYESENLWELSEFSYLRAETKDYVPKLIAAILIAKEPEKYGFGRVPGLPPVDVDVVTVPTQTDLAVIAASAGTTVETIRTLNPLLRSYATPPSIRDFEVKVPMGSGETFRQRFARLPASQRLVIRYHTVRRGENPSRIAARYGVSARALMAENGIRNARRLRTGQRLRIPRPPVDWQAEAPPITIAARAPAKSELAQEPVPAPTPASVPAEPEVISLARAPEVTRLPAHVPLTAPANAAISDGNGETGPAPVSASASMAAGVGASLQPRPAGGEGPVEVPVAVIVLPPPHAEGPVEVEVSPVEIPPTAELTEAPGPPVRLVRPAPPPPVRITRVTRYRVKPGETLYRIARKHGVTVADMERWNPQASSRIFPGMVLILRPSPRGGRVGRPSPVAPAGEVQRVTPREDIAPAAARSVSYRVQSGDTLWSIARRHGVTVEQVLRWNRMRDVRIHIGDRLLIRTGLPAEPAR